jgi:FtsH-binding integral membrane protein
MKNKNKYVIGILGVSILIVISITILIIHTVQDPGNIFVYLLTLFFICIVALLIDLIIKLRNKNRVSTILFSVYSLNKNLTADYFALAPLALCMFLSVYCTIITVVYSCVLFYLKINDWSKLNGISENGIIYRGIFVDYSRIIKYTFINDKLCIEFYKNGFRFIGKEPVDLPNRSK